MVARPLGAERALAVVASMLDVDFAHLAAEAAELEAAGADRLQWNVMDGRFVPKLTHGADLLARTREYTRLPFEAHLMVDQPENLWRSLAEAGADLLIVHAETTAHLHLLLSDIRQSGRAAGVADREGEFTQCAYSPSATHVAKYRRDRSREPLCPRLSLGGIQPGEARERFSRPWRRLSLRHRARSPRLHP